MLEKIKEKLESLPFLITSFIFLVISVVMYFIKGHYDLDYSVYLDPILITILLSGFPILYEAIEELIENKKITSSLLITIAIIASLFIKEVLAAGVVAFIMALGEFLEELTVDRARKGVELLASYIPKTANVLKDNEVITKEINDINIGDIVRVLPGEEIPVDGIIIKGDAVINMSILNGESLPVDREIGSTVYAGSFIESGSIDIEVTKTFTDTSLNKMLELIDEASKKQSRSEKIADKWASVLVPVSLLIAVITFIVTYLIKDKDTSLALYRGVTVLVVFCPCALSLATPTTVIASIAQATKKGVLIKSGDALENISRINSVVFDKTGTLTYGKTKVDTFINYSSSSDEEILKIASSLEELSKHPFSVAIKEYYPLKKYEVLNYKSIHGKGISGEINNTMYYIGSIKFLNEVGIDTSSIQEEINNLVENGKAVIGLSNEKELLSIISISDILRPTSISTIEYLNNNGYKVSLLSGDNYKTASYIGNEVGITDIKAELLPENKVELISESINNGDKVMMIGDGINDAPSLKIATVGVSLGGVGSDITVESSSVCLLDDDIDKIPYLLKLSKIATKTIKFNIIVSLVINFIALILSTLGILNPILGALVHNIGSLIIIFNAGLIYNKKIE